MTIPYRLRNTLQYNTVLYWFEVPGAAPDPPRTSDRLCPPFRKKKSGNIRLNTFAIDSNFFKTT